MFDMISQPRSVPYDFYALYRGNTMRNFIAWMLLALMVLAWPTAQVIGADVRICPLDSFIDSPPSDPSLFEQDRYPENTYVIAQSLIGDYGKQPKEQWERDRKLQAEQIERVKRWDEHGKMRRCKQSCYETYRTCSRRLWDPRSQSCQRDFDNCIRTCE